MEPSSVPVPLPVPVPAASISSTANNNTNDLCNNQIPYPQTNHLGNHRTPTPDKQLKARAKAKDIKLAQERALTSLVHNGIYIALYIRDCPPKADDFHWALYRYGNGNSISTSNSSSSSSNNNNATKHHARNLGSGWITEHERVSNIFKELNLCCLLQIGCLNTAEEEEEIAGFEKVMRSFDVEDAKGGGGSGSSSKDDGNGGLNALPGINCRVWLFLVLRRLVERGLVRFDKRFGDDDDDDDNNYNQISKSLEVLQRECMRVGNEHMHSAALNVQPRPVIVL